MGKRLVAYFSAGGTTKKVAEMIANSAEADLFEIEPKIPYTKADLDWMDQKSRSSMEMNDKKFRPEVLDTDTDFNAYDEIICNRQIMMRPDIKLPQPFASWSNSL